MPNPRQYHMDPLWIPEAAQLAEAAMARFFKAAAERWPDAPDPGAPYRDWHRWACARPDEFWSGVWEAGGIVAEKRPGRTPWDSVVSGFDRMAPPHPIDGPKW